jgi:predicted SAM-dependent methyltransferase
MAKQVKVALGSGWRNYGKGWTHVDLGDYKHIELKQDVRTLWELEDNSVDVLYASHVFEYFDREEAKGILEEWKRVLKKGGALFLSVPDFEVMSEMYSNENLPLHKIVGPLYGKMDMGEEEIYHKTVYDYASLGELLKSSGFRGIDRYIPENLIRTVDDHSKAMMEGRRISLNVVCIK